MHAYYNKKHPDSLHCLINCAEYQVSLHIIPKPGSGKNGIYSIPKIDGPFPLFFYDTPSNKVIDEMQTKNEAQKLFNKTQKIKTENEIFDEYEQYKKNKMLLFRHIQFPLINTNSENNAKKLSSIIILDNGEHDKISTFGTNSSNLYQQTCSIFLAIKNINNCDYLFSLKDIKDSKEIKIRLNGTVHNQKLFDSEIICFISPELITNSIRDRMQKYSNIDNIENLIGKYFFTKLNDNNYNNIGILFSLKKKRENSLLKYDKEYLNSDRYVINRICLFIDMWLTNNNANKQKSVLSTSTSTHMVNNNKFDNKNVDSSNFSNDYDNNNSIYSYNYNYNNIDNQAYNNMYYNNYNQMNDINSELIYNDINEFYPKETKELYYYNDISKNLNSDDYNCNYSLNDNYIKSGYHLDQNNYHNNKKSHLNILFNLIEKMGYRSTISHEPEFILDNNTDILYINEENEFDSSKNINYNISDNIIITLFIDTNKEIMGKLFEKYKQDECISNYTIVQNMLDINMNIDTKMIKSSKIKLMDFFDIFKNINRLYLNIPFITQEGNLFMNCFSPTLSAMVLLLNINKNIKKNIKNIKKKCSEFEGFNAQILEKNKKILKIEFEEIHPSYRREILYNKIVQIKKILGNLKLKYKNVLLENSYFSVLWQVTNNSDIKSSFLTYYSFDFKLIGILIKNLNKKLWLSPFSDKLDKFHDYINDYKNNVQKVKCAIKNMEIDNENYYKSDYYKYLYSDKAKNY